jgi:hypothetical protein
VAGAAGAAGRRGRPGGRLLFESHQAKAAGDEAFDGLSRFRMRAERGVLHALDHLETARSFSGMLRDGFVNIGGHAKQHGGTQNLAFSKARTPLSSAEMKIKATLERYYVLPCCLLLLNLCNAIISYKAELIHDGFLRTLFIMGMVLCGSSLVAFAIAPGLIWVVQSMRRTSRSTGGGVGEGFFLIGLGMLIFWLYYRNYLLGTEYILPAGWRNQ